MSDSREQIHIAFLLIYSWEIQNLNHRLDLQDTNLITFYFYLQVPKVHVHLNTNTRRRNGQKTWREKWFSASHGPPVGSDSGSKHTIWSHHTGTETTARCEAVGWELTSVVNNGTDYSYTSFLSAIYCTISSGVISFSASASGISKPAEETHGYLNTTSYCISRSEQMGSLAYQTIESLIGPEELTPTTACL